MADCCLTGRTEKDTLINHVKWLSSWAITMTKKVEALNDLVTAMTVVDSTEARRAIAGASGRMVTYTDDRTPEDPFGLKLLVSQFERAKAMVSDPSKIPCYENEKPEEPTRKEPIKPDVAAELGAMTQTLRFCMVADTPVPDIEFGGTGTAEDLVKIQDTIRDSVLLKKAASADDIMTALKEAGYDCQVELTPMGSDMKCGLKVSLKSKETVPVSSEEQLP